MTRLKCVGSSIASNPLVVREIYNEDGVEISKLERGFVCLATNHYDLAPPANKIDKKIEPFCQSPYITIDKTSQHFLKPVKGMKGSLFGNFKISIVGAHTFHIVVPELSNYVKFLGDKISVSINQTNYVANRLKETSVYEITLFFLTPTREVNIVL